MNGTKQMAQRIINAEENFLVILQAQGSITKQQAEKVFAIYKKLRVVKRDAVGGNYAVKHGAFLDKEVIQRALGQ